MDVRKLTNESQSLLAAEWGPMQQRKEAGVAMDLVREALATPKVLVVASECAEELVRKNNGLTLTRLLQPFGRIPQRATVELEKTSKSINNMCCEFVEETRYDEDKVQRRLHEAVAAFDNAEEPYAGVPLHNRDDVARLLQTGRELTPWFQQFSVQLGLSIGSVEHENFGQPVACVVAISSTAENAVLKMKSTFETIRQNIRNLFPEGLAPSSLQAQFVLLHDDHEGPTQSAMDKLRDLQSTFGGQHCHLLRINSLDLMQEHKPTGLTTYLSENDLKGVQDFCKHVVLALVVPKLVDTLQTASRQLDAKKKTFSDTLATWWGGGKKSGPQEEPASPASGLKYSPQSVVMLYRKVADCAFVLQYYDLAYSAYRACAKEVKKSQDEWLAGCVEMATICSYFTSSAPRDFFEDMEKAGKFYSATPGFARFALRCSIFAAALCKGSRNHLRAGAFYADYAEHAKAPLVAALLQEQASLCLLYLETPRFRRLAFRLVFAARKFALANQHLHALRCYRYAQGVYMNHDWRIIDDHLRYSLGRLLASHGRLDEALDLYQLLLCDSVASKERQATYMREMMALAEKVDPPRRSQFPGFHSLMMPVIVKNSARVLVGASKGGQSSEDELEWAMLEKQLQRFGSKMHRRSVSVVVKSNRANDCAVEEPSHLEVTLSNPLAVPLHLSHATVSAFHEPLPGLGGGTKTQGSEDTEENGDGSGAFLGPAYTCDSLEIFLLPGDSRKVSFKITPLIPGALRVRGIRTALYGQLNIVLPFDIPMVKMRSGRMDVSKALDLNVSGPMPLLECELDVPATMMAGEMRACRMRLANLGKTEMRSLRVKCSHPAFAHFSTKAETCHWPGREDDGDKAGTAAAKSGPVEFDLDLRDLSVWEVPMKTLGPDGASVDVHVWLRAAEEGTHVIKFLFYYEAVTGGGHRWCRFAAPLRVFPMLRVETNAWSFPDTVDSYLVGVTIRNMSDLLRPVVASVDQICCGSFQWTPRPIEGSMTTLGSLQPGLALQLAFRVSPHEAPSEKGMYLAAALVKPGLAEMDVRNGPLFALMERENSERILAETPEDSLVSGETFVSSAVQLGVLWSVEDADQGRTRRGVQFALDVSVFSHGHQNLHQNHQLQVSRKTQALVTPGAPVAPPTLRFELQVPEAVVRHDFAANGLCIVNGMLEIANPFPRQITCQLQAHSPTAGSLHTRMCYFFAGKTLQKICLEPLSTVRVELAVGFASCGSYAVDRYQLLVGDEVYFPQRPTLIQIEKAE